MANFWYLFLELNSVAACKAWASFLTDRHVEYLYRVAKFEGEYKFVFYKVSSPPSPSSLLKLPINVKWPNSALSVERKPQRLIFLKFLFQIYRRAPDSVSP